MHCRTVALLAWSLWALSATSAGLAIVLASANDPTSVGGVASLAVSGMAFATVGAIVTSHRPAHPIGWILCATGLALIGLFAQQYAVYALVTAPGALPAGQVMAWFGAWPIVPFVGLILFLLLLFPDGQLPSRAWRPVAWFVVGVTVLGSVLLAFSPFALTTYDRFPAVENPLEIDVFRRLFAPISFASNVLTLVAVAACVASVIVRFQRAVGEQRQQLKWLAFAALLFVFGFAAAAISSVLLLGALVALPISVGIAVLKYRLYDLDIIINRTLVYGGLSAAVVGSYVVLVGSLAVVFQGSNPVIALVATGLVAVFFQPLRTRVQRKVDRLMYGERDDPYLMLSKLGRMETTLAPGSLLPAIVEALAQTLNVRYVAIALKDQEANTFRVAAAHGTRGENALCLPLVYQTETVGQLLVGSRAPGEAFSGADRRLLTDLCHQIAVIAQAIRLAADLQRSRDWLAREMHDSLGHRLTIAVVQLEGAGRLIPTDPDRAARMIGAMREQLKEALGELRRTVAALRTPFEDVEGGPLVPALIRLAQSFEEGTGLPVHLGLPVDLPTMPETHRLALYRAAQETLTNVQRHAAARQIWLTLDHGNGVISLTAADDGSGFRSKPGEGGFGLTGLRERATQLGGELVFEDRPDGGAQVRFTLPLREATGA